MSEIVRPPSLEPVVGLPMADCDTTSRLVSPVSITSVAISTAPSTRTTRPPTTPDSRLLLDRRVRDSVLGLMVMVLGPYPQGPIKNVQRPLQRALGPQGGSATSARSRPP